MGEMKGLAHVGVFVSDLERTKAFYRDVLEFDITWECTIDGDDGKPVDIAFAQNGNVILELVKFAEPPKREDGTVDHIAIAVEDIEQVKQRLEERGVTFETKEIVYNPLVFPQGSKWILFRGPDNEHLELTEVL